MRPWPGPNTGGRRLLEGFLAFVPMVTNAFWQQLMAIGALVDVASRA